MKKNLLNIAKGQMGAAHLEAESNIDVLKSFLRKFIQVFAMTRLPVGSNIRCRLERLRGVKIGKSVFLAGGNILDRARPDLITLEDYTSLSGGVQILTHSNPTAPLKEILGDSVSKVAPVTIKRGAWIAINAIILPGVTIGENSIVTAGSVVSRDIPPFTMVGGSPARVIKKIDIKNKDSNNLYTK